MRFCNGGMTVELDKGKDIKGKVSQPPIPLAKATCEPSWGCKSSCPVTKGTANLSVRVVGVESGVLVADKQYSIVLCSGLWHNVPSSFTALGFGKRRCCQEVRVLARTIHNHHDPVAPRTIICCRPPRWMLRA